MKGNLENLLRQTSGSALVEYGFLVALIGVVILGSLTLTGDKIQNLFSSSANSVNVAIPAENTPTLPPSPGVAPELGDMPDITISMNDSFGPIMLDYIDPDTADADLQFSASSDTPSLIDSDNLIFDFVGNWSLRGFPKPDQSGTTRIWVTIFDGSSYDQQVFTLTVESPPR